MKFLLFRILLLYRTRDRGFTLPMVIGIGLIMVLLSSVALVQSSEENLIAISKDQSSTSLAMAELGIARYRELLNNNRVLAVYSLNHPDWGWTTNNISNQTCDVISNAAGGWADTNPTTGWRDITLNENDFGVDFNDDGDQTDPAVEIGSYKLVNYIYDNDDDSNTAVDDIDTDEDGIFDQTDDAANPDNPKGILTVQGRDSDDGSIAQIQVNIPIGVNIEDLNSLDPGIWIHQENLTSPGTIPAPSGNIVLYKQSTGSNRCADTTLAGGIPAIRDPRDLPPLVTLPDPTPFSPLVAADKINTLESDGGASSDDISGDPRYDAVENEIILGTLAVGEVQNSDDTAAGYTGDDRYYYYVGTALGTPTDLTINDGQSLITDGTAKVIIYVDGNLNINGNVNITNSSDDATSKFLEIHVTGNVTIDGPGTVDIKGLIHAPQGTVTLSNAPIVNLTGSIWANNWTSNGTVNLTTSDYEFYSITPERTPNPLTYAPTGWEQQEVD